MTYPLFIFVGKVKDLIAWMEESGPVIELLGDWE